MNKPMIDRVNIWDSKQYALGILFTHYILETLSSYINKGEREAGIIPFNDRYKLKKPMPYYYSVSY